MLPSLVGDALRLLAIARLDHHTHERLGARGTKQHATVVAERSTVTRHRRGDHLVVVQGVVVDAAHVHEHLRVHVHDGRELSRGLAGAHHLGSQLQAAQDAVSGRCVVAEDDVPRLLATERQPMLGHRLQHVPVADGRLDDPDAVLGHRDPQSQVAHRGHGEGVMREQPSTLQ
jgi:hypothetical protein